MPEPSGSPSNPSPSASEFFDASSIISAVQGERDLVEETTEATKSTSENTQSILDEIRGDIGSAAATVAARTVELATGRAPDAGAVSAAVEG